MIALAKNLYTHRELLYELTLSNLVARYKQSILGVAWAVLQPLALMVVSLFIFSHLAKFPSDNFPYPIFVYTALIAWTLLSSSLSLAVPSLVTGVALLRKVYFPREIFVIINILIALVDFAIAAVLLLVMLVYFRISPTLALLSLPLVLFIQLMLITGLSLIGSIVNAAFRDIARALPILLQVWMLASPVFYPMSMVPQQWRGWYALNPMVGIVEGYRYAWLGGAPPPVGPLAVSLVESVLIFAIAYTFFRRGGE